MDNNIFEELFKYCGYNGSSQGPNDNNSNNTPPGAADEECRNSNSDIPGGFQDVSPQLFIILGEILGTVMAGNLPFNIQNSIGNWLQLVGQAILTANAQQQYFQGGPGRYYDPIYRNSTNPFCPTTGTADDINTGSASSNTSGSNNSSNQSTSKAKSNTNDLEKKIDKLQKEIEELKKEMKELKKDK